MIIGWSNKSVGEGYDKGYDLKIKYKWIKLLSLIHKKIGIAFAEIFF